MLDDTAEEEEAAVGAVGTALLPAEEEGAAGGAVGDALLTVGAAAGFASTPVGPLANVFLSAGLVVLGPIWKLPSAKERGAFEEDGAALELVGAAEAGFDDAEGSADSELDAAAVGGAVAKLNMT